MSMEKNSGPTHPFTGQALLAKGQVLVALNQPRLALDALNAALAISAAQPQGDEEWGADVLFATAKAQWALGEHRDALRTAHHANEVYRRVGSTTAAESQAELASWLARR